MEKEILKQLILISGLSQKDFSVKTNTAQPRISEWLNGKRLLKLNTLNEIANHLGFSVKLVIEKEKSE